MLDEQQIAVGRMSGCKQRTIAEEVSFKVSYRVEGVGYRSVCAIKQVSANIMK